VHKHRAFPFAVSALIIQPLAAFGVAAFWEEGRKSDRCARKSRKAIPYRGGCEDGNGDRRDYGPIAERWVVRARDKVRAEGLPAWRRESEPGDGEDGRDGP